MDDGHRGRRDPVAQPERERGLTGVRSKRKSKRKIRKRSWD
jgi:hypothetical protein